MRHISDSERLTLAQLNKKETELKQAQEEIQNLTKQLQALTLYIKDLRGFNNILVNQVNYLVHKKIAHD